MGAPLRPGRYYLLSDAGSFYFDPTGDNEDFESPEAAWTQAIWPELDLSDEYAVASVLGSEFNANEAAWEAWEGAEFPDAPRVHNYARELGLVREGPEVVRSRRERGHASRSPRTTCPLRRGRTAAQGAASATG